MVRRGSCGQSVVRSDKEGRGTKNLSFLGMESVSECLFTSVNSSQLWEMVQEGEINFFL